MNLTNELIDHFFEYNTIHSVGQLSFSGGNPPLNGEVLEYIVDQFIKRNIPIYFFLFNINGQNYNEAFVRGLNKLNEYCKKEKPFGQGGALLISQTQYHQPARKEVIEKYKELPYFIAPTEIEYIDPKKLLPYGNASENHLTTNQPDIKKITDYNGSIKITEYENEKYLVFKTQYISSNGNILIDGCTSYDIMDQYKIGNIKDGPMTEIYKNQPKVKSLNL